MTAFYLKYRPQKISELDSQAVREQLTQILASPEIPHAFLFSGPKGLGKTSAARLVAKAVNCLKRKKNEPEPCNRCSICLSINSGQLLDLIEIDAASNRGIDDIRELRERIKLAPSMAQKKVYVIDEVHMLTKEAFNALLKTLEEPPKHALFILCTTEPEKLPATIISRCQELLFKTASPKEIIRSLQKIIKKEKISIADHDLELIALRADGSFRDAAKIMEKLSFSGKKVRSAVVEKFLDTKKETVKNFIKMLSQNQIALALKWLNQAVSEGTDLKALTKEILIYLRDLIVIKISHKENQIDELNLSFNQLKNLLNIFDQAAKELKGALIAQLPLEMAIWDWEEYNLKFKIENLDTGTQLNTDTDLENLWKRLLTEIKKDNHSLEALLKSAKPLNYKDEILLIEVFYEFHKNKLENKINFALIENRAKKIFGDKVKVKFKLKGGGR